MKEPVRTPVLIVEDHPLFRQGLRNTLEDAEDLQVVGEAEGVTGALEILRQSKVSVALVDLRLQNRSGLDLVEILRQDYPEVKALVLSAFDYPHYIHAAVEAGAVDYLLKDEPASRILSAIRCAARGKKRRLSPAVHEKLEEIEVEPLTAREGEIVALLADGQSLHEIASLLRISIRTVRNHLNNIYSKLDLHSQTELVAWAWRTGTCGP
ncbi:MAG: response regulator transcription factor [Deltaproteobacteria bacterium]|nr:response regulator transcription factor [Deltaproteobacteria bacterium]